MPVLERISLDPNVMGGRPCIQGTRITVGLVVRLIAAGRTINQVLAAYPDLTRDDVTAALAYAAWRAGEREIAITS